MPREPKAYLHDMREAAALIAAFTEGLDFDAYAADAMVRAAVERQFEIIGEALGQLVKVDPDAADRISEHRRIIAFRNILVHQYDALDYESAWQVIQDDLPRLVSEIDAILGDK